jgi:hypothetical protein
MCRPRGEQRVEAGPPDDVLALSHRCCPAASDDEPDAEGTERTCSLGYNPPSRGRGVGRKVAGIPRLFSGRDAHPFARAGPSARSFKRTPTTVRSASTSKLDQQQRSSWNGQWCADPWYCRGPAFAVTAVPIRIAVIAVTARFQSTALMASPPRNRLPIRLPEIRRGLREPGRTIREEPRKRASAAVQAADALSRDQQAFHRSRGTD